MEINHHLLETPIELINGSRHRVSMAANITKGETVRNDGADRRIRHLLYSGPKGGA